MEPVFFILPVAIALAFGAGLLVAHELDRRYVRRLKALGNEMQRTFCNVMDGLAPAGIRGPAVDAARDAADNWSIHSR
jgi:hypothetical protein